MEMNGMNIVISQLLLHQIEYNENNKKKNIQKLKRLNDEQRKQKD